VPVQFYLYFVQFLLAVCSALSLCSGWGRGVFLGHLSVGKKLPAQSRIMIADSVRSAVLMSFQHIDFRSTHILQFKLRA
jgi:hypothetical protein